jgi:ubiquitin carboxyl-terminal hydrolase 7
MAADDNLSGSNQYEIEGQAKVDALRVMRLRTVPPVLMIKLDRIEHGRCKINTYLIFPIDLDVAQFMEDTADRSESLDNELFGVIADGGITPDSDGRQLRASDTCSTTKTSRKSLRTPQSPKTSAKWRRQYSAWFLDTFGSRGLRR